jgi:hypothetical protein
MTSILQSQSTDETTNPEPKPIVRVYTISELADSYKVSTKTIKTWLKPHAQEIGPRRGRYYTLLQVRTIFEKIGLP